MIWLCTPDYNIISPPIHLEIPSFATQKQTRSLIFTSWPPSNTAHGDWVTHFQIKTSASTERYPSSEERGRGKRKVNEKKNTRTRCLLCSSPSWKGLSFNSSRPRTRPAPSQRPSQTCSTFARLGQWWCRRLLTPRLLRSYRRWVSTCAKFVSSIKTFSQPM